MMHTRFSSVSRSPSECASASKEKSKMSPKEVAMKKSKLKGKGNKTNFTIQDNVTAPPKGMQYVIPVKEHETTKLHTNNKTGCKDNYYRLNGFPYALQLWFYECCPYLNGKYSVANSGCIPRMLRWSNNGNVKFEDVYTTLSLSAKELGLRNLTATASEIKELKLEELFPTSNQRSVQGNDNSDDDFVNPPTPFLRLYSSHANVPEGNMSLAEMQRKICMFETCQNNLTAEVDSLKTIMTEMRSYFESVFSNLQETIMKEVRRHNENDDDVFYDNYTGNEFDQDNNVAIGGSKNAGVDGADDGFFGSLSEKELADLELASPFLQHFGSTSGKSTDPSAIKEVFKTVKGLSALDGNIGELPSFNVCGGYIEWLDHGMITKRNTTTYYSKEDDKIDPTLNLGVDLVSKKTWFHILEYGCKGFTNSHVDVFFYHLRKKVKENFEVLSTDSTFQLRVSTMEVHVYNTLKGDGVKEILVKYLRPFCKLLPYYMRVTGFYERHDIDFSSKAYLNKSEADPLGLVMHHDCVKSSSIDSGMYMVSFAEYVADKKEIPQGDLDIGAHRSRLGFLFYSYGMAKQIYGCESEGEDKKADEKATKSPTKKRKTRSMK
ncbi:hypothetical protein ACET3Z_018549 [Daucus carota]